MEMKQTLFSLFLLLSLQSFFLFFISSAYAPPDRYFINCGSDSNITVDPNQRRVFIGDLNPGLSIDPGKSRLFKNNPFPKSLPEIYYTARVYDRPTWYVFHKINQNGTHVLRLHFFPLSSETFSRFDVWASSGHQLLSNFSLYNTHAKIPTVKEFIFELQEGALGIQFSPSIGSSMAFVNAIELFLGTAGNKPNSSYPVSPELRTVNDTDYDLASKALQHTYRINVGGSLITPEEDSLWRTWLPDDDFLTVPAAATSTSFNGSIKYGSVTTIFIAPIFVYRSARELNMDSSGHSKFPNLTWVFKVRKNTKYFVHLHWCYIMDGLDQAIPFDFFLDSNRTSVGAVENFPMLFGTPYRLDMAIVSENSGLFRIGVAPNDGYQDSRPFLNGIEIMELIEKSLSGPILKLLEENKQRNYSLLIGLLVAGVLTTALLIGFLLFYYRTKKSRDRRRSYQEFLSQDKQSTKISITDLAPNLNLDLKIPFAEIQTATNNFDETKVIGVGGFGKVYQGTFHGKEVAVKRSRPGFGQGKNEFQTEIIILSQIRYRHLVTLYGYCDENEEMILVYEFMEMGTLRQYLYGLKSKSHPFLTWKQRLEICIDAAKGLDYLHTGSAGGVIIHRDIKTTNILLDKNGTAKVSDFGISKSGIPNPKEIYSTIRGTYGYLDPEYFNTGQLTEKSDVYSFGVVLFEVVAARPPIVQTVAHEEINLAEWAVVCKSKGELEKLMDPLLVGTIELNSLRKFVEAAEKCVNEEGAKRPSMHDVVQDLEVALQYQNAKFEGSTIVGAQ